MGSRGYFGIARVVSELHETCRSFHDVEECGIVAVDEVQSGRFPTRRFVILVEDVMRVGEDTGSPRVALALTIGHVGALLDA
jgi:hypothetical protein